MLIFFKGAGCTNCPFYHINGLSHPICMLDGRKESGVDRPFSIKITNPSFKPQSCPFMEYIGSLEICAEEVE
jgi:hypothetical protein